MFKFLVCLAVFFLATDAHAAQFSENSCIVMREHTTPTCFLELAHEVEQRVTFISDTQIVFSSFEDAIAECPFEPVLIEFTGTVNIRPTATLKYAGTSDITIRGVPQQASSGEIQHPVLIGFNEFMVVEHGINVTFENFIMEGCGLDLPLFSSENSGCLINQSLTANFMSFRHFKSNVLLCQYSDDLVTTFIVTNSSFVQIAGTSIYVNKSAHIRIVGNVFYGRKDESSYHVYANAANPAGGSHVYMNNEVYEFVDENA